jgi:hypothetical protein
MATTTQIATENKRPSLSQNIESLYATMHAGGAFDAKSDLVLDGTRNQRVTSLQEIKHTPKGFKTKMLEQQSELYMAQDQKVVTTRMRTSIYGDHSSVRYH